VFPGEKGHPWSTASIEKLWGRVRRQWNLEEVKLHDLRRSCASYLAMAGENLFTVQAVLNNASLQHTSIYARLNTKAVDRALQRQADRFFDIEGPGSSLVAIGTDRKSEAVEVLDL
jgi:integrase